MGKSREKVTEAAVSLQPTKAEKNDKRRVEEAPEDRASSKKQKIETEQVDQNKKKVKKLKKSLNESPGEKKDKGKSLDFEYGVAEAMVSLPPMKAAKNDKRRVEEASKDRASSNKQKIETEQVDQNKKKVKKLKKTLNESPGEKIDEGKSLDFEYGVAEATVSLPPTKAAKNDKRSVEEAPEDRASSKKQKIEIEQVDQSKKKVKKLKKALNESPGEKKDKGRSLDFEYGVAEATVSLPPMKAAKNDKRRVEEALKDRASSKMQKIGTEQVDQNKKNVKKLKKTLNESPGEKKDEGRSLDFEYGFAETPITIPPTKAATKGKRGADEATEKQASSKNQIVELEKVGLSKKMVKKLKKTSIECPGNKNDETWCSDFGVEKSDAPKTKPVSASKKKPELTDGSSKSDSDEEVGKPVKSNHKAAIAVSKKKGDSSDSSSESDSGEEVKETGNKRMDSLPDNAKNKDPSKISEKEPETPAKQNEECGTKRLFVGNLPSEATKDDLLDFFNMFGEVMEIRLASKEDGSFRGFGHVEFVTEADARAALRMNGHVLLGRPLIIDLAREMGSNNPHDGKENGSYRIAAQDPGHSVFVKGFGKSLKEDQIRNSLIEHFGSYGKIIRVSIPQDHKTGRSKGFAYVLFNDQASVSKALELSGTELGGYTLTVQEPTPMSGTRDGSFSGGRGRGGRSAGRGGGHDDGGRGRGRGGRGPGASYNGSATTANKGKKTAFDYND
ncbi:hypothetical protein M5K25_002738 [Dendrobium thyrsiflorum]|uniref:RRM domain-containing protein n=1 Tax=Dendrobium thyrsiflorum TaxID=117978 RepID=A0ABD0VN73_DENTH